MSADRLPATGKTLEELDALFARSPEVRERLENNEIDRRASYGSVKGPPGRRASQVSATNEKAYTTAHAEKV